MGLGHLSQTILTRWVVVIVVHEPLSDYFYHMANDYQGSILGKKKTAQNLHLDNQPPCDFFTMGFMPTHTTGVNFRFIAFAFQPRRVKYDLGIMRADRVRYGQVVISHFMKNHQTGAVYQIMSFRFCGLGVFTVSVNLRVEKQNSPIGSFIFNSSPQRGIPP